MKKIKKSNSLYRFIHGAVLEKGHIYIAGIAKELEDRNVPHTIIWERIEGEWKRYQWKNRTYDMAAFDSNGGTAVYVGFEGTLKVRSLQLGSSIEVLDAGNDGPSSLRPVSSIRVIGDFIYVVGMRRMIYRRALDSNIWDRFDENLRLPQNDLLITGLDSIDGLNVENLYSVGRSGEIWQYTMNNWLKVDSPTNADLYVVRCLPEGGVVIGGKDGALFIGENNKWKQINHTFPEETFVDVELWQNRCFVRSSNGSLFELDWKNRHELNFIQLPSESLVMSMTITPSKIYFFGENTITSLDKNGWKDESPPDSILL
tara:strand:+ start:606 stop:1550 length:945 start_codon:yes stop_codon:yes gene_type:complete